MNDIVKQSIEGRKNAIFNSYNVTDQDLLDKIEDLFNRINEFGEGFDDAGKFEAEFANSPLNKEYMDIFVEIAKKDISAAQPSVGEVVADRAVNEIKNRIRPSRAVRADKRDQALRDIPVVGDVMQGKQTLDLFKRFKKNK